MKSTEIKRNILVDEPSQEDRFKGKGHERTAFALSRAIAKFDGVDRAIGLDGPWGSGKSSVVEIAETILKQQEKLDGKPRVYHFFTFDIWKSQGSAFRRSFLEHLLQWAKLEFTAHQYALAEIEKRVKGKTKEIESNNRPRLDFHGILVLMVLPFLPLYYFWAKSVFDETHPSPKAASDSVQGVIQSSSFLFSLPFILLCLFSLFTLLWALKRYLKYRGTSDDYTFGDALSQTLLVSSKQHSDQKITQQIREIDPNDYEFRETIREILAVIQTKNQRVVFVLDNIDRLPSSEILEYWALVRSIFSRGNGKPRKGAETITAIVPYAHSLIQQNDTSEALSDGGSAELEPISLASRELFSKTFDEILTVSPPVMSNVREFFVEKMKEALPNQADDDTLFRVYRIFTVMIQSANGVATPRQIISFINDLSGEFSLHEGRFGLPTIAAFVAYRNRLEANPHILSEGTIVSSKIATLAADPDIGRNMAALTFNVEPELAFQILLDDKIKTAAIDEEEEILITLSSAPGFEDRVADVVLNSVREWVGTDEYGQAVQNFSALAKIYKGQAKQHFCTTIVSAFKQLPAFNLSTKSYEKELLVLNICEKEEVDQILLNVMAKINMGLKDMDSAGLDYGKKLATLLIALRERLIPLQMQETITNRLANLRVPTNPDFAFGLAGNLNDSDIRLLSFQSSKISFTEDNASYLQDAAINDPLFAAKAYAELNSAKLLTPEKWVEIANSLIEKISIEDEFDGKYAGLLELLSDVWSYAGKNKQTEIQLSTLFETGRFYQNMYDELDELKADEVGYALFLAHQNYMGTELPQAMTQLPNNQRGVDNSEAYQAFKALFDGEELVSAEQAAIIATTARDAVKVYAWVQQGAGETARKSLVDQVVRAAFTLNPLPRFDISAILKFYDYLKSILGTEEFSEFLSRFSERITDESVEQVALNDVSLQVLEDTNLLGDSGWGKLHRHVDQLLQKIKANEWEEHIQNSDGIADQLCQRVKSTKFIIEAPEFKEVFVNATLGILGGDPEFANVNVNGDDFFFAIEEKYHGDVLRRIRDEIHKVSATSLKHAAEVFPDLLPRLVTTDDRMSKTQKDNLVRNLLCPALESNNSMILDIFLNLGRTKVADFVKNSEKTTRDRVEASCKHFSKKSSDKDRSKLVSELILGRRAKTLWEKWVTLDF